MKAVYFLLLSFLLIPSTRFSQEVNDRTTGIKIERLFFWWSKCMLKRLTPKN